MITIEQVIKKINAIHDGKVLMDISTYKNTKTKARFVDSEYGEFWAIPFSVYYQGSRHPMNKNANFVCQQKALSMEEMKTRFPVWLTIDEMTYKGTEIKAKFFDEEYGEFWMRPRQVARGSGHPARALKNRKSTMLKLYGCEHANQNKDIMDRVIRSSAKRDLAANWETKEEVICIGSYERFAVDYLNANKIRFAWHPRAFLMPNGKVYHPDLYLIDSNMWVEIKGYMREHSKKKWDWFCSEYSNSELWDKKRLQKMGML